MPLSADLVVVFGGDGTDGLATSDDAALTRAAERAASGISQVSSAKRLADELELLHAVHNLAQTDAVRIREVMRHVVRSALEALSCDLGALYVAELDAVELAAHEPGSALTADRLRPALRAIFAEAADLPACVQDSTADPPPEPLSDCGVTSHYVLPIGSPPFAVLALVHTEARPRGFTSLCREVGLRLAEAAQPLLRSALTLHELETRLDQVGRDARIDPLTRLPNRRAWDEALEAWPAGKPVGVVVIDADKLKVVNDERGHHAGDEYLQLVAETVSSCIREGDVLARFGGDEFTVLIPDADELACHAIAKRIQAALAGHRGLEGFPLNASVGYATAPPAASVHDALLLADERMYQRKQDERRRAPAAS